MLLVQENSKLQDLKMYADGPVTLAQSQSGWDFTVKQGVTTIHEDSAAYMISTSSLTMKVEAAVIHALCWIASRGDMESLDWNVLMIDIYL